MAIRPGRGLFGREYDAFMGRAGTPLFGGVGPIGLSPTDAREAMSVLSGAILRRAGRPSAAQTPQPALRQPSPAMPPAAPGILPEAVLAPPPPGITGDQLRRIMPRAGKQADIYAPHLAKAMRENGIVSPYQQAAFLAQVGLESGQLNTTEENLRYRAPGLVATFGDRFPSLEVAATYVGRPEAIANTAYARKNGNGDVKSGDGYRYRGRGLIQVTGRGNYKALGYEDDPDALLRPDVAAASAGDYWASRKLAGPSNRRLNRQEFDSQVTRKVNAKLLHAKERWDLYNAALNELLPAED